MPAEKGSIDKSLRRRVLDGAKYVGKNFWKVLPVGSGINYHNKFTKGLIKKNNNHELFHSIYATAGIFASVIYFAGGIVLDTWTPAQMKKYNEKEKIKAQDEANHRNYVDYRFNRIFQDENAKTFQDTVDIYQKYGLPIRLLNPTLEQKEKAIKQNELERSVR